MWDERLNRHLPHHATLRCLPACATRRDLAICVYASNMSHTGRTTQLEIVRGSACDGKGINRDVQNVHELRHRKRKRTLHPSHSQGRGSAHDKVDPKMERVRRVEGRA